jgi:glutaconate CoA-transferase, subunit B
MSSTSCELPFKEKEHYVATQYATEYTIQELQACFLSREIQNGEDAVVGAALPIARAAIMLAHLTHGPDIRLRLSFTFTNLFNVPKLAPIRSEVDFRQMVWAEAYYKDEDVLHGAKDWGRRMRFFIGAVQVDPYGNSNLLGVGPDIKKLKFRGPGGIGTTSISAAAKCYYIMSGSHDKRLFVEKCDYITSFGWGKGGADARKKLGLPGGGPKYLLTPLCVLDFEEKTKHLRLKSVNRGVKVQDVIANTGFELVVPEKVPTTEPPTTYELKTLRERVDVEGFLRK